MKTLVMLFFLSILAYSAENVSLMSGAYVRSIPVSDVELFIKTGTSNSLLGDLLKFSKASIEEVRELFSTSVEWDFVEADEILRSDFGDSILERLAVAVHPRHSKKNGKIALRAAIIISLFDDGVINLVELLKNYPTEMRVDIGEAINLYKEYKDSTN